MSDELSGRIGIVTGASAGIGLAIVHDLVKRGARVVANARREDRLIELQDELCADRIAVVVGDAAQASTIDEMFQRAESAFGSQADLVVVNAGRGLRGSVTDSNEDEWEQMIQTNLVGAARLMRRAANHLAGLVDDESWQERARDIVVLGSNVGRHISPFSSMYGSTKFAVNSLAEALRRELASKGVRVTLIEPGVVQSEFQDVAGYEMESFGQFMDGIGPVLVPEDVARVVGFIVSLPIHVHVNDVVIRPTRQEYP